MFELYYGDPLVAHNLASAALAVAREVNDVHGVARSAAYPETLTLSGAQSCAERTHQA
jgi:hypothetical protein